MTTNHSTQKEHVAGVPESNAAVSAATAIIGALAGAATGAIAGPFGAITGGVIGALAGAATGQRLAEQQKKDERDEELLDEEIGVIDGDLGAPQITASPWVEVPASRETDPFRVTDANTSTSHEGSRRATATGSSLLTRRQRRPTRQVRTGWLRRKGGR